MPPRRLRDDDRDEVKRAVGGSYRKIYAVIRAIPRGKVMTYGQVADVAGLGRAARLVGYALRASHGRVPWQRVLGKRSRGIAQVAIKDPLLGTEQRLLLEHEGVRFSPSSGVDLARYGHVPPGQTPRRGKPKRSTPAKASRAQKKPRTRGTR